MEYPTFELEERITAEQKHFLKLNGFLHFKGVASSAEVNVLRNEIDRVAEEHLSEGRTQVHGTPFFFGEDERGSPWIQRLCFTSLFSKEISQFINDGRFRPILDLLATDARIAEDEYDGVVVHRYLNTAGSNYTNLGWHTDVLYDVFSRRLPQKMLNVGLHLDKITKAHGGLRIIPGTQDQSLFALCFRKLYFASHSEDRKEVCIETDPGDLTIHDGRLWHRVAESEMVGKESLRRTMYVPFQTGPKNIKNESSKVSFYHQLGKIFRSTQRVKKNVLGNFR